MDLTSAFISPSQVITFLHLRGQKKKKNPNPVSQHCVTCCSRRGEEESERPACVNTQRGALFLPCRPRGGVGGVGVEEGSGCRGGLLWSKLYLRLKLKTALSTQLEPDISHLPLLGWKSMWWRILQSPPPKLFLSLSLPPSLFLLLFLSADSQHVHWHKCSFFCFCFLQPCTSRTSHPQKSVCLATLGQTYTGCTLPYAHIPTRLLNMHLITSCSTTAGQCCCMCAGRWSSRTRVGRAEALLHSAEAGLSVLPRQ